MFIRCNTLGFKAIALALISWSLFACSEADKADVSHSNNPSDSHLSLVVETQALRLTEKTSRAINLTANYSGRDDVKITVVMNAGAKKYLAYELHDQVLIVRADYIPADTDAQLTVTATAGGLYKSQIIHVDITKTHQLEPMRNR